MRFQDYVYRAGIVIALAAQAVAVVALVAYLATRGHSRELGLAVVPADRVALGVRVEEHHAEDVRRHQHEYEHGYHLDQHAFLIPPREVCHASRSAGIAGTISRHRRLRWD